MLVIFGMLYATGLHTEAIGQVQRLLLATGLRKVSVPEPTAAATATEAAKDPASELPDLEGAGFQMVDLAGKSVSFDSLKGKVIFLNIWATWCPPCIAEMPNIQSLYNKIKSDKIVFVMLSLDKGGSDRVRKFIQRKGFTFPVYLPASQLPQALYSPSIPATFIISPEGQIVARQEGMATYDTPEMREFLQSLAARVKD